MANTQKYKWQFSLRSILVLVTLIGLCFGMIVLPMLVRAKRQRALAGPVDGWSGVATIGGVDLITDLHVESLLQAHGIESFSYGSVVYAVCVPTTKHSQAISVIKEDLGKRSYNITLHTGTKDLQYIVADSDWQVFEPKIEYKELVSRENANSDLGVLLRSVEVTRAIVERPYVRRIRSLKREYLDANSPRETEVGHEFEIELVANLDGAAVGRRLLFQVWDQGRQIEYLGGN